MGVFNSVFTGIKGHFNKKSQEQKIMDELQKEADRHRLQVFRERYLEDAKKVAESVATREAAEKSGLQRLRATNRKRNLSSNEGPEPGSFFEKLRNHTQKNLAQREENLKKTSELRMVAESERMRKMNERKTQTQSNIEKGKFLRERKPNWRL